MKPLPLLEEVIAMIVQSREMPPDLRRNAIALAVENGHNARFLDDLKKVLTRQIIAEDTRAARALLKSLPVTKSNLPTSPIQ